MQRGDLMIKINKYGIRYVKRTSNIGISIIQQLRNQGLINKPKNKKTKININKTKNKIKEILINNLDNNSWFVTLTYSKNIQDYKQASIYFNNFMRSKVPNSKYLCLKELQQRGAIHYHLILFDVDFKVFKTFRQWFKKHGRIHIQPITKLNPFAIANYVTEYLDPIKNQLIDVGYRVFTTSRNLIKTIKAPNIIMEYIFDRYSYDLKQNEIIKIYNDVDIIDFAIWCFGKSKVIAEN